MIAAFCLQRATGRQPDAEEAASRQAAAQLGASQDGTGLPGRWQQTAAQQSMASQLSGLELASVGSERLTDATGLGSPVGGERVTGDLKLPPEALYERATQALQQRHMAPGTSM